MRGSEQSGDQAAATRSGGAGISAESVYASPQAPALALPKGGGAIRGIGEKFAANPVTGTGAMSVPIATPPGRSGFGPQLSLSYDSGAGNSPFGFGWSLALPTITRKTDKGLPQYRDAQESDVFILSGAEDLVPVLNADGSRFVDTTTAPGYTIHRYRPRIEGLFARIERWSGPTDDVHWRSISKDNILTIYGASADSCIADSEDARRIFSWLICESRDDKGNAILYEYKRENGDGLDLTQAHECNRGPREDKRRTANRYLKRIRYGNLAPMLDDTGQRPRFLAEAQIQGANWMFEVVFDYGEHDANAPTPNDPGMWSSRVDPFSSYRAGFEVRTTRLCQRVLSFHHFDDEMGVGPNCLVRSTDFTYTYEQDPHNTRNPIYTFLRAVTQSGYKRNNGGYLKHSLPAVVFEYTLPILQDTVEELDAESLENLPVGLDGAAYQWTDLHGEGIPGVLVEHAGAWFYKRNISPISEHPVEFAPVELVATKPNLSVAGGRAQFMDLAGDGQPDLVVLDGPVPGLYEHDHAEGWQSFRPFTSRLNRNTRDPNVKFLDLDGDGHADVLISEDETFVWYASLAEEGFGPAQRLQQALDEEIGPRLVFADGTQSIYLADMCGDGLTDLVRIRNGQVCYWPNLGYGHFGAKITMDRAPYFDHLDQFDHKRIRLADIDGSGTTDIIYLHRDGVRLYFNQSGNSWSEPRVLSAFPRVDDLGSIIPTDLLGNGTACLVWSSPLPGDARRPMRYINLMGGQKPHLLIKTLNNLGAETRVEYAPSTKFYLQDKRAGRPWITRLPFPVHVVERVETYDHISRNRFVTRYVYHHGYFDGEEREFRGFGMVEQWDTEEIAALTGVLPSTSSIGAASNMPPVHTKTWFHTGAYLHGEYISRQFEDQCYREPGLSDQEFRALLLPDTILPTGLGVEEEREACRALKGSMLRQEVYADDAPPGSSPAIVERARTPYTVVEQNFTIRPVQPRAGNRHAAFFTHPREAITYQYERNPADPRVQHAIKLEVDDFGDILKEVAIGYGRRQPDMTLLLQVDRDKQTQILVTYTENRFTNAIDDVAAYPGDYRAPLPCETRTYEVTGLTPEHNAARFSFDEWTRNGFALPGSATAIAYEQEADSGLRQKRLIEHVRTLYRKDDLTALLPLGALEPLALPGESYKLAFTAGLLGKVFRRNGQPLLPNPATVLGGQGAGRGGYVVSQDFKAAGLFPAADPDEQWWIPAGRVLLSPDSTHDAGQEWTYARSHFFLLQRYRDPFHAESIVTYDAYDLLMLETRDALGNRVTVGERLPNGNLDPAKPGNDYRVLQPRRIMDPNRNRVEVAFDGLGRVVGTAVMGKPLPAPAEGDSLDSFEVDLTQAQIDGFYDVADPRVPAVPLLNAATTRVIYDLERFQRTQAAHPDDPSRWLPAYNAIVTRETHASDPLPAGGLKVQVSFSYSDGFGREIQKKILAEPGPLVEGGPLVSPRWVGSGWTIFNNKGKPVRQYEPFFSQLPEQRHRFEFGVQVGVSPILFYDPVERVVAILHPNHSYEKAIFDPWQRTTWDINDTVLGDPRTDTDIRGYIAPYFAGMPAGPLAPLWQTWHAQRQGGALGPREQAAAAKTAAHAGTPTTAYFDTLGRPFLTIAQNKVACPDHDLDGTEDKLWTRIELDIEGNQRAVRDTIVQNNDQQGRIVMRYEYDMLGNRIHQRSMEAGTRWMLNDVTGKPIRAWDSRGHAFRTEYDSLRRSLRSYVVGADPANPNQEVLAERLVYGEQHPQDESRNLRGRLYLHLDQAGAALNQRYDFKGNLQSASRRLTSGTQYRQVVDWLAVDADQVALPPDGATKLDPVALEAALAARLEAETLTSHTTYDALNRQMMLTMPHTPTMASSIIRPNYNEANLLDRVEANLDGASDANGQPIWTPFVTNIDYNARGQRTRIDYATRDGRLISTSYRYDPETFRLTHLYTRRGIDPATRQGVAFTDDCENPQPPPLTIAAPEIPPAGRSCGLQNLHYTYDPMGNITHIRDDAQQTIYFRNKRVEPSAEYTYDALYRLIEATGREHLGQVGGAPIPHTHNDAPRVGIDWSANDGNALGTYVERYVYDAVGNFLRMQHCGTDPAHPGWTRSYAYNEPSLIEDGLDGTLLKTSNRLSSTTVGNGNPITERYVYDAHGNMTRMPHLGGAHPDPNMHWNERDQLCRTDLGGGGMAYYVYDAAGQRVRKVWEKAPGLTEERIYLGGFEIFRRRNGGGAITLERETLHIMDDQQRIALVETRTQGSDPAPQQIVRYQFGNQLGSASLELDDEAQIISYEEYAPYGSTLYQAVRSQTETPKRYRYTGKERDEESGLYYHKARYYAPWLGRWASCDPIGIGDGIHVYAYVLNKPINRLDDDGKANAPIHEELTTLIAMEYVDVPTAAKVGRAANTPDLEEKYESTWESVKGDPSGISKDIHVLGWGTREEKIEATKKHYSDKNREREKDSIRDAGVHLLHPLQDANYHLPGSNFGPGMGHALFPEADLAVGNKTFDEFYQVVKDTRMGLDMMKKEKIIGSGGGAIEKLSKKEWMGIYNDLKSIEQKHAQQFLISNIIGAGGIIGGLIGGVFGGMLGGLIGGIAGFFVALFTGKNVAEGFESGTKQGATMGEALLGVGLGTITGLFQNIQKNIDRNKVADEQSAYLKGKISEIANEKAKK